MMFESPENVIREVELIYVIREFGPFYKEEGLSLAPTHNTSWYANDYAAGSLFWRNETKARIKGTLTRPEYRGFGYGAAMLNHLVSVVQRKADKLGVDIQLESYARNPKWYFANGFELDRITPWGVTVVRKTLHGGN